MTVSTGILSLSYMPVMWEGGGISAILFSSSRIQLFTTFRRTIRSHSLPNSWGLHRSVSGWEKWGTLDSLTRLLAAKGRGPSVGVHVQIIAPCPELKYGIHPCLSKTRQLKKRNNKSKTNKQNQTRMPVNPVIGSHLNSKLMPIYCTRLCWSRVKCMRLWGIKSQKPWLTHVRASSESPCWFQNQWHRKNDFVVVLVLLLFEYCPHLSLVLLNSIRWEKLGRRQDQWETLVLAHPVSLTLLPKAVYCLREEKIGKIF